MQKLLSVVLAASLTALACVVVTGCKEDQKPASSTTETPPAAKPAPPAAAAPAATAPASASTIRVRAGATTPFTDPGGNVWLADQGFEGGDTVERPEAVIANTKTPALYQAEHYAMSSFSARIANGKYLARLHFAETYDGITGPGQRVFSFTVHGHEFKDFDVWVKSGGANTAYVEPVPVEVTNGTFKIDFISNVENPQINAIEVVPQP